MLLGELGAAVDLLRSVCSEDLFNGKDAPHRNGLPTRTGECEVVT